MKLVIRSVALALTLAGAFACTQSGNTAQAASNRQLISSSMPAPACPPNDPAACQIDKW